MGVKLVSKLPAGDGNGLDSIVSDLIKDPKKYRVVLAILDSKHTMTDNDTGDVTPKARIRRIEVVLDEDLSVAENLIRRSLDKRSGGTVLPFDLEEDLRSAFPPENPS